MFSDQDDIWLPDRIENFIGAINRFQEAKLILSDGYLFVERSSSSQQTLFHAFHLTHSEIDLINQAQASRVLVRHVFATGAAMAVQRNWSSLVPEPQSVFLHDEWLAWMAGAGMRVLNKPTFLYRQHPHQVTGIDHTITGQVKRLFRPQAKASHTLDQAIDRLTCLMQIRLEDIQPDAQIARDLILAKIAFLQKRRNLPSNRIHRFALILFKIRLAPYRAYGSGWRTVLKDLFHAVPDYRE